VDGQLVRPSGTDPLIPRGIGIAKQAFPLLERYEEVAVFPVSHFAPTNMPCLAYDRRCREVFVWNSFAGGLFAIGGALIAIPLLTAGFSFTQHDSQGDSSGD
jgi:hypothetical protein